MKSKLSNLQKQNKWMKISLTAIFAVMIFSFVLPEEYYTRNLNILLLNIQLLIIFGKDLILFYKKACKSLRIIMVAMSSVYLFNIIERLLPSNFYCSYLLITMLVILASFISMYANGIRGKKGGKK